MIYSIAYSKSIDKVLKKWKKSNPVLFKKYSKLLEELMLHPREGLGHPEALVKGNDINGQGILLPMIELSITYMMK